jgi:hypothetical protein
MKEKELRMVERDGYEYENEEKLGEEKFPPLIRLSNPPLTVANQGFGLNDANDEKDPSDYQRGNNYTPSVEEHVRRKTVVARALCPGMKLAVGEEGEDGEGD